MANTIRIDRKNNHFQHIEVLKRNRKKRSKYKEFFVEGAKSINNAKKLGWDIETIVYSYEKPLSDWAKDILKGSTARTHLEVSDVLLAELADKEEGSELLAVIKCAEDDLSQIDIKEDMIVVVFDRPSNHGNLGTLIRTCEALKVDALIISGHAVDMYDTRTIRASLGTFFSIPIIRVESPDLVEQWFDQVKSVYPEFQIVGSTAKTEKNIDEVNMKTGIGLLIGNETAGLSYRYKEMCDQLAKIPMYGKITSFNVGCAASIMIYEIERQRRLG